MIPESDVWLNLYFICFIVTVASGFQFFWIYVVVSLCWVASLAFAAVSCISRDGEEE